MPKSKSAGLKREVRLLAGILVPAVAFLAVAWWVLHVYPQKLITPWPERLPTVRLEPTRPNLTEDEITPDNAYYYLRQLVDCRDDLKAAPDADMRARIRAFGWDRENADTFEAWWARNARAFELARAAAACADSQVPTQTDPDGSLAHISLVRYLTEMFCFRAEAAADRGDWDTACSDYRTSLAVAASP